MTKILLKEYKSKNNEWKNCYAEFLSFKVPQFIGLYNIWTYCQFYF